jgi:hypothetical protein
MVVEQRPVDFEEEVGDFEEIGAPSADRLTIVGIGL